MATLEEALQQTTFESELVKANLNVLYTANWLYNKISAVLKPYNLTHEQFNVLRILKGSHPNKMCQKDILSRMIAPNSNLTLIIKKLVDKNYVQVSQSDTDKRHYDITITEQGSTILESVNQAISANKHTFNGLTVSESFHLNALLDKLRED